MVRLGTLLATAPMEVQEDSEAGTAEGLAAPVVGLRLLATVVSSSDAVFIWFSGSERTDKLYRRRVWSYVTGLHARPEMLQL